MFKIIIFENFVFSILISIIYSYSKKKISKLTIFNMWSKGLKMRAKKSNDLYFKIEGVLYLKVNWKIMIVLQKHKTEFGVHHISYSVE